MIERTSIEESTEFAEYEAFNNFISELSWPDAEYLATQDQESDDYIEFI